MLRLLKTCLPLTLLCGLLLGAGTPPAIAAAPSGLDSHGQMEVLAAPGAEPGFRFTPLENGAQLRVNGLVKNVLFYGPETVRVNTNLGRVHTQQPSLVVEGQPAATPFEIKETPAALTLASAKLTVRADKQTGALTFLRPDGAEITREGAAKDATDLQEQTVSGALTYAAKQTFALAPDESLYGLGQYNQPYMDYRGQTVLMVQTNIGIVIPFLLSTRRYGILWDAYSKSIFQDDAGGASFWAESAPAGVDYYFVAGPDMDGVIGNYRRLTGAAPMYPKAAFGLFMSKERYKTQDRLVEVVRRFRKEGFPIDYIVQDWQYWGGTDGTWSGMIWDKQRFPDPAGLTKTLHEELHVKLMNSIWPSIGDDTELAHELDAKKLRFASPHWISRKAHIYDAYSPEGRAIYFKYVKKGLLDVGVDALWMDGTEVEVSGACHDPRQVERDIKGLGANAMGDFTRYLNPYSLLTTKGTYEGQRATSNQRVLTLTRSAWAGQQRYAAMPWSGDTTASWRVFREQICGGLNVGMAGQPYWTQDTGGFFVNYPGGENNPEYRELFARWNQFGAFNPVYRIHGTNVEREPYLFKTLDPEVYQSLSAAARLRYRLLPYLYGLGWQTTQNGYTMMRGLAMDFPDDQKARKIDDAYLFGPAFLVHPVTRAMYRVGAPPPPPVPAEALQTPDGKPGVDVEYFDGTDLQKSVGKTVDAKVDYTWPGPPLADFPAGLKSGDRFSGRWQGVILAPEDGEYEIGVEGDDGFRLWLDGKLLVEDWRSRAAVYKGARLTLRKGQKLAVKIEYYQDRATRLLRLCWKTPSQLAAAGAAKTDNLVETYLPAGADWYDFWTNERLAGGQKVGKACPLDILPLYVRAGSIVPMGPFQQYATEQPNAPYDIRIYPGADAKFTVYEDDNETYDYEKGQRATYDLVWRDADRTLVVGARAGAFPGMAAERKLNVALAAPNQNNGLSDALSSPQTITYTGAPMEVKF